MMDTQKLILNIPRDMHEVLTERRQETGAPVAEIVRRAVRQYLEQPFYATQPNRQLGG
jgi:predicted GNAT superfamily acetyltransferase